jgi:hypothetical protein
LNGSQGFRRAHSSDTAVLLRIRCDSIIALASSAMGKDGARIWADSASDKRVSDAIDNHEVWVSTLANQIVGWVEINRNIVEGLYVDPEYSSCGIGTSLL